jgi:hypothetical protein
MLGRLLIANGLCSADEVATALEAQSESGIPLGGHLIAMGALTHEELQTALHHQDAKRAGGKGRRVARFAESVSAQLARITQLLRATT